MKICEFCQKHHDGSYGSGRFCSKCCSSRFSASPNNKITLEKMQDGSCSNVSSNNIRKFLLECGIKENKCEICGLSAWQGKQLVIQLHHIDGNKRNNMLSNLMMLCPNCHSITDTYGYTGIKKYG